MARSQRKHEKLPPQHQGRQPGRESAMAPRPRSEGPAHRGSGKLAGKVAMITGGDSGIGRAVAIAFAREGASVAILYFNEHEDARETQRLVEAENAAKCLRLAGNIAREAFCRRAMQRVVAEFGRLDILVNNAGEQHPQETLEDITAEQLQSTFRTNIFAQFYLTKAALPHLEAGATIINTTSVTAYRGSAHLLDNPQQRAPSSRSPARCRCRSRRGASA